MTIAEVSRKYTMPQAALRYYQQIGLIPPVKRATSGRREYEDSDLRWIEFIKSMRGAGVSIDVLVEYVALFKGGESTARERKALLMKQRQQIMDQIAAQQAALIRLNHKLDEYEEGVLDSEDALVKYLDL